MAEFDPSCVYTRDASWYPRSAAGGKTPVYHAIDASDVCMAACSPTTIMLNETSEAKLLELHESELCKKPACQRVFARMRAS